MLDSSWWPGGTLLQLGGRVEQLLQRQQQVIRQNYRIRYRSWTIFGTQSGILFWKG